MNSKEIKSKDNAKQQHVETPIQQMRPDESTDCIMTPPSEQEVKAAVEEMNPDENSMNSRG